jgi:hypothetical protein
MKSTSDTRSTGGSARGKSRPGVSAGRTMSVSRHGEDSGRERVARNNLPWVVIPAAALTAWEERDPAEARTLSVGARALVAMLSAAAKRG